MLISTYDSLLPDSPEQAWWLKPEEKRLVARRLAVNQTGKESREFKMYQVKEAISDPKILAFFLMGAAIYIVNGGVTVFGSQIVKGFGYSSLKTVRIPGASFMISADFHV